MFQTSIFFPPHIFISFLLYSPHSDFSFSPPVWAPSLLLLHKRSIQLYRLMSSFSGTVCTWAPVSLARAPFSDSVVYAIAGVWMPVAALQVQLKLSSPNHKGSIVFGQPAMRVGSRRAWKSPVNNGANWAYLLFMYLFFFCAYCSAAFFPAGVLAAVSAGSVATPTIPRTNHWRSTKHFNSSIWSSLLTPSWIFFFFFFAVNWPERFRLLLSLCETTLELPWQLFASPKCDFYLFFSLPILCFQSLYSSYITDNKIEIHSCFTILARLCVFACVCASVCRRVCFCTDHLLIEPATAV